MFRYAGLLLTTAVVYATASDGSSSKPQYPYRQGLTLLFEPGPVLQDRNEDGRVDFVAARLVMPDSPAPEEVAAVAAVAARLGFETSGLSLPLVFRASELSGSESDAPLILFGSENPLLPEPIVSRLESLGTGQGLVSRLGDTFIIAGKDPLGTRVAGESFASRSPYLWDVIGRENGDTFERIGSDLFAFLEQSGITVSQVSVEEIVFETDRREAVSATLAARVTAGEASKARELLASLGKRHARGEDTDKLSYSSVATLNIELDHGGSKETVGLRRVGLPQRILSPRRASRTPRWPPAAVPAPRERDFDLSDLFTTAGILADTDGDRIADSTETVLVLPSQRDALVDFPARGAAHLAARIGLESTGLSFPLAKLDSEVETPIQEQNLILMGGANRLADELRRLGKRHSEELAPGTGVVEVVANAFGETPAVVVAGADQEGSEAAADYLAHRAPYLWAIRRGEPTLDDVENSARALLDGRTAAGQASLAIAQLDEILRELESKELERVEVHAFFEEASPGFDRYVTEEIRRRVQAEVVQVKSQARRDPVLVFEDKPDLEWEVDGFWKVFREKAIPAIQAGSRVSVELRVSESPELRRQLAEQIRADVKHAGGLVDRLTVLSAYKQGLSWLEDKVAAALDGKPVAAIEVSWKPASVDTSKKWRFYDEPARWLSELYPADEVLARELNLPLSAFSFVMQEEAEAIYQLTARDGSGEILYQDSFSPAYYERPWFDAFPDEARVKVTTGWITVRVDGEIVIDERLATDPDRIWDHYQGTTLAKVYEHIHRTTAEKPTQDKQPFFHTLRFELKASEPDYRLGVDQELISSLESIHDSVYYDGLDFFNLVVEKAEGKPIRDRSGGPGNILPWIHPEQRGRAPELVVTYSDNASPVPKLVVDYKEKGGEKRSKTIELTPVKLPRPSAYLAELRAGQEGLARLWLRVIVEDAKALGRLADLLDNLSELQAAGVFEEELSFTGVAEIAIRLEAPGARSTRFYRSPPTAHTALLSPTPYTPGERLVTWDHVVSPEESERIVHTLGTLPHVTAYVAGRSYQGRPVSVMELNLPMEAELISQAKMSTWKPVLSIMARQHANEVSSTSHVLRLAELLATDPAYQRYLKKMNIVIQPVVNPDGAALAYRLQELTPFHCLHAGRYSALGPDVPTEAGNPYTLVTEALVLDKVFNTWLPDIQLNPHGYATHEQVQMFANYKRYRFRSYWIPRGWYTSIRVVEDPRYRDHRAAAYAMRDYIAEEVSKHPRVRDTNLRIYDRYRRWAIRWQPHVYNLEIYRDTAIYFGRRSSMDTRLGARSDVTVFSAGTEAMDETAQGAWMDVVARMGFGFLVASLRFLEDADDTLYRREQEIQGKIRLSVTRPRPLRAGRPISETLSEQSASMSQRQ